MASCAWHFCFVFYQIFCTKMKITILFGFQVLRFFLRFVIAVSYLVWDTSGDFQSVRHSLNSVWLTPKPWESALVLLNFLAKFKQSCCCCVSWLWIFAVGSVDARLYISNSPSFRHAHATFMHIRLHTYTQQEHQGKNERVYVKCVWIGMFM